MGKFSRRIVIGAGGAVVTAAAFPRFAFAAAAADEPSAVSLLRSANVSLIATALSVIGLDPKKLTMSHEVRPLSLAEGQTVVGSALTTKWEVGRGRMTAETVERYIYAPLDSAPAGSIWVVAGGSDELYSLFGDIIAMACRRNGMAGAVTDNGCRDIAAIRAMQFPVFARSAVPYGPGDAIRPVAADEPVVCGGVLVNPGDLLAADVDGVIVIPRHAIDELTTAVEARGKKEQAMREAIHDGARLADTYTI
jgi:4-hydroxy-4-methyl-2-oxoglutarate aldolase